MNAAVAQLKTCPLAVNTATELKFFFFTPVPPHVYIDFVVPPPGCGRSVTAFWGLGRSYGTVTLPGWCEWWYIYMCVCVCVCERGVPGRALNLNSTNYPDHGRHGDFSPTRENTQGRAGYRTRDLMVCSQKFWPPSHEAGQWAQKYNSGIRQWWRLAGYFSANKYAGIVGYVCYIFQFSRSV
jgi:hypothetical protein